MKTMKLCCLICLFLFMTGFSKVSIVGAQPGSLTKEEMIQYTSLWKGERFPDGRPKVPDDIIGRMKYVSITEAWGSLQGTADEGSSGGAFGSRGPATYNNQYYGGFKQMYDDVTICGRVSTIQFMPYRPDINNAIQAQGTKDGRGRGQYTWGIDQLQSGDVYVANVCEAILDASHVGDNLGTAIFTKSGNGAIIRGTVRDLEGNMKLKGFNIFVRDFRPESNSSNMVIGINGPIQIGYVTVMPGDIVLAKREGVVFIPPHLATAVVEQSEKTRLQDVFAHMGVKEGRFTAQQADGGFTEAMNLEFTQWLNDNADNMAKFFDDPKEAPSPGFIRAYVKDRKSRTIQK
jgi:4-hydroxy-4-methyl-2-oxoglutarate aldolase